MRNLKSTLSYNLSSENSYLKLFQIANQNLSLVQKRGTFEQIVEKRVPSKEGRASH